MATAFGWIPGPLDIEFTQGEDFVLPITVNVPNPGTPPPLEVPMNQTGASYKFQIRSFAGGTILVDANVPPSTVVAPVVDPTPPDGLVTVTIPRVVTAALAAGGGVYDFWILDAAGVNKPYAAGSVTINAAVSVPEF